MHENFSEGGQKESLNNQTPRPASIPRPHFKHFDLKRELWELTERAFAGSGGRRGRVQQKL